MALLFIVAVLLGLCFFAWPTLARRRQHLGKQAAAPPGTARLDDVDALRPDVDAAALASARQAVPQAVPDSVLADALLDTTPAQLRQLFAAVPEDIMAQAIGSRGSAAPPAHHRQEDLALLRGAGDSVDDLEIWSFSDKT